MELPIPPMIASLDASRPVFLIVMGLALVIFSCRFASNARSWSSRLMILGSAMLAFGYAVIVPAYEGGLIERLHPIEEPSTSAVAWHIAMLVTMNCGWLVFGTGIALHAKLFPAPIPRKAAVQPSPRTTSPLPAHESIV